MADATGMVGDRAGFEKPICWWLRAWWLSNVSTNDAGRPKLWPEADAGAATTIKIVDSWDPPPSNAPNARTIHVYTNAPWVRLWVNGILVGRSPVAVAFFGMARFEAVPFAPGNLTAEALDGSSARVATTSVATGGGAAKLRLSLDAPSPHTGTGEALVADGQDVAMVRAELLDASSLPVSPRHPSANSTVVRFAVISGGGLLLGTHNGAPTDEPNTTLPFVAAHAGMARAFIRSTELRLGSAAERQLLADIHLEAGRGPMTATIMLGEQKRGALPPILVRAEADGLEAATLSIPMTVEAAALPAAVASESVWAYPNAPTVKS